MVQGSPPRHRTREIQSIGSFFHPLDLIGSWNRLYGRPGLVQYQSRTDSVSTNARFRWEYQPGSELFVVYSDGRSTLTRGIPDVQTRSFVIKVTRLFQF